MHIKEDVIVRFSALMEKLLESGTTAASALKLCREMEKGKLRELCDFLYGNLRQGKSFAQTIKSCGLFPHLYCALAEIGEKTGTSAVVFKRLSVYLAQKQRDRRKIEGALAYPAFVLMCAVLGTAALFVFVLPRMNEIFSAFGGDAVEKHISGMYRSVTIFAVMFGVLILGAALVFCARRFFPAAALFIDKITLLFPFVGPFLVSVNTRDLFFAMELCGKSGMNIRQALEVSSKALKNSAYRKETEAVEKAASRGESIARAFCRWCFPACVSSWLLLGESTGQNEEVFFQIREFFEDRVDRSREVLMGLAEPVLILAAGIIIFILVINLVVPLYELYGGIV
jgi:type II secretory pathway component PulF